MSIWAIVPVKPLRLGKSRLERILSIDERARLVSQMLRQTLRVLSDLPEIDATLVVSRDPAVLKLARRLGAATFEEGRRQDLNVALTQAGQVAAARRADWLLVLPADLPLVNAADVRRLLLALPAPTTTGAGPRLEPALAICSDQHGDGTNALLLPPNPAFRFSFGPGSFHHHQAEARRLGIPVTVVEAPGLRFDLDTEADWQHYRSLKSLES